MKQAAVATSLAATGVVLQGCQNEEPTITIVAPDCDTLDADACIFGETVDGERQPNSCAWDPETRDESCELEEDAEQWLFEQTGQGTFESCAPYESLPAKQCVSMCEYEPTYKHEKSDGEYESNLFLTVLDSQTHLSWKEKKVYFYLPKIVDSDISNNEPEFEYDEADYPNGIDAEWKLMDWAAYDENFSSDLLKCEGYLASTFNSMNLDDPRYDAEAGQTEKLRIFPSPGGANPNQFVCGGQTFSDANNNRQQFVDAGLDAVQVIRRWRYLNSLSTSNEAESISFVQSDLENLKIILAEPSDACNSDRNCGLDLASGMCQDLITYCDFWSDKSDCFGEHHDHLLPSFDTSEPVADQDFDGEVPEGLVREFAGKVKFDQSAAKCMAATTDDDVAVCAPHPEFLSCSATPIVSQQGEVSENLRNYCVDIYAEPVAYDPASSSVTDLSTFSINWEVVNEADANSRGCANFHYNTPGESDGLPLTEYVETERAGYAGYICTLFSDYFCFAESERDSFIPDEIIPCTFEGDECGEEGVCVDAETKEELTEEGEGECYFEESEAAATDITPTAAEPVACDSAEDCAELGEDYTGACEGLEIDEETGDVLTQGTCTPVEQDPVEQGPCNNVSPHICAHTPEFNGECLSGDDFYAKYIDTPNKVTYEDLSEPEFVSCGAPLFEEDGETPIYVQALDEETGEPLFDEETGEPIFTDVQAYGPGECAEEGFICVDSLVEDAEAEALFTCQVDESYVAPDDEVPEEDDLAPLRA